MGQEGRIALRQYCMIHLVSASDQLLGLCQLGYEPGNNPNFDLSPAVDRSNHRSERVLNKSA